MNGTETMVIWMVVLGVTAVVAVCAAVWLALFYMKRYNALAERVGDIDFFRETTERFGAEIKRKADTIAEQEYYLKKWELVADSCARVYFTIMEEDGRYGVVKLMAKSDLDAGRAFVVKRFWYNPADPEDKDFAIREAEELKETIERW